MLHEKEKARLLEYWHNSGLAPEDAKKALLHHVNWMAMTYRNTAREDKWVDILWYFRKFLIDGLSGPVQNPPDEA